MKQIFYQLITNDLLVQFLLLSLLNVYQSFANQPHPFYYIVHIAVIVTDYSNLLHQCFTNHYQSEPVLYITSLRMITNKLLYIATDHSTGNFLPVGGQCFNNHQFTNGIGKFTIGSYWQ